MNNSSMITMEGISKSFGATRALTQVDLQIARGEVTAIVGSNGAGKSTLMKTLAGIYKPDSGTIRFNDRDITGLSPAELQRMGIQVVHQVLNLVPSMTVLENVLLANPPLRHGVLTWREGVKTVERVLKDIDFPLDLKRSVGTLSASEQQFVILARALIHRPEVLVLDEPTARLGLEETGKLFSLVRRLKAMGTTIVYISHRMQEIYEICDRISVFRDGTHVLSRSVQDLSEKELVQAMLGKQMETFFPKKEAHIGDTVVEIRDLRDGDKLDGINLTVRKGEIVSLVGAVGAGKSEVLECLFGLRQIKSGDVSLNAKPMQRRESPGRAIRNGVALIPEDRNAQGMFGDDSIRENISSVDMRKVSKGSLFLSRRETALAQDMIQRLDVRPAKAEYRLGALSGGNAQKVVIGKWLTRDYSLYLMDEVTAGVDIEAKAAIYHIMGEIAQKGGAVLLATGDIEEALQISDRVAVVYKGRIIFETTPSASGQEELLGYIMGGGAHEA